MHYNLQTKLHPQTSNHHVSMQTKHEQVQQQTQRCIYSVQIETQWHSNTMGYITARTDLIPMYNNSKISIQNSTLHK